MSDTKYCLLYTSLEKQFYEFMDTHYPEIGREIKTTGKLDDATEEKLRAAIEDFKEEARESSSR